MLSVGQGNVFTGVCLFTGDGSAFPQCYGKADLSERETPTEDTLLPPVYGYCYGIRSTSGWCASYWNAYLFMKTFYNVDPFEILHHG